MNNEYVDIDALLNKKTINICNSKGKKGSIRKKAKPRKTAVRNKKKNIGQVTEKYEQLSTSISDMVSNVEPNSIMNLDIDTLEEVDNIFANASEIESESSSLSENILPISNIIEDTDTDYDIKEDYRNYETNLGMATEKEEKYVMINNGKYKNQTGLEKNILFEPSSQKTYIIVELLNNKQNIKVPIEFINYIEEEIDKSVTHNLLNQYFTIPFLKLYGVASNLENIIVKVTHIIDNNAILLPIHPLLNKSITKTLEFLESFEITDEPSPDTIYSIDSRIYWNTNPEIKKCNYLIKNCGEEIINGIYKLWEYPYDSVKMSIDGKLLEDINGPFYYNSLKNNIILMKNNKKWYIVDMDLHNLKVVNYYYFNQHDDDDDNLIPPNDNWTSPDTFIGKLPTPIIDSTEINTLRQSNNVIRKQFKSVFDEETLKILSNK